MPGMYMQTFACVYVMLPQLMHHTTQVSQYSQPEDTGAEECCNVVANIALHI